MGMCAVRVLCVKALRFMVIVLICVSTQVILLPPLVSRKISYRGENALLIQRAVRMYLAMKKHRPRSAHTHTFPPSHTHTHSPFSACPHTHLVNSFSTHTHTLTPTLTHTVKNYPHTESIPVGTKGLQGYVHFVGGPRHSLRSVG